MPTKAHPVLRHRLAWVLLTLAGLLVPVWAHSGSFQVTVQSTAATSSDAYLEQDNVTALDGTKSDLRIKSSSGTKNRHMVVSIPTTAVAGKSVLSATLNLREFGANNTPIEARVYPLTQSFIETQVSWRDRATGQAWTTAGGTRDPHWTDRRLVSSATNNQAVGWQVGPIVNAWLNGDLANCGFVIESDHTGSDREVVFRSSEYTTTPSHTPQLVLTYTDEAPALRRGYAEFQPSALRSGALNTPLTLWLDVDAAGATVTGAATGFDQLTIAHGGTIVGRGLYRMRVAGVDVPLGLVSWSDNGDSITIRFPKVTAVGKVQIDLRVDVLAAPSQSPIALPVTVDDTTTPTVWSQMLWPRDADGVAGNGDSWFVAVTTVTRVDLTPDSTTVIQRLCTPFTLYGVDDYNNRFPLTPDSLRVVPQSGNGTVSANGVFCGTVAGTALVVGYYRGMYDFSRVTITPALVPVVSSITLRDRGGTTVTSLAPQDTMFLDLALSEGDGFRDLTGLDFDLSYLGHAADLNAPAFHARLRWRRGVSPAFSLVDPVGSSWTVLPALCSIDTTTNSTSVQTVRLAFRPGVIARASTTGGWTMLVKTLSATPPDTSAFTKTGISALAKMTAVWDDSSGAFNPGSPGTMFLPLRDPPDSKLDLRLLSNTGYTLEAAASDLAGVSTTSDTLRVGAPARPVSWAFVSDRTGGGRLDTAYTAVGTAQPAAVAESPVVQPLYLWIDHPASIATQDYRGQIRARLAPATGSRSAERSIPVTATVASSNPAAQSGVGEVLPNSVQVGVPTQSFTAYLLATFGLSDTGIDCIRISVPEGYGTPFVNRVRVDGVQVTYTDASRAGIAEARLALNVAYSLLSASHLIEVRFQAATPTVLDPKGANFVMQYDDLGTSRPPQVAAEGDADNAADGDDWLMTVTPGPVASVSIAPDSVTLYPGQTQQFTAKLADAFGNPLTSTVTWSATGGIGTIGASGLFTANAAGAGQVVAASGGIADTARVTALPTRGLAITAFSAPSALFQGEDSARVTMKVANLGADSVRLDTLALRLTRVSPGDANADFVVSLAAGTPSGLAGLDTASVTLWTRVLPSAATGTVLIDGRVAGIEVASGAPLHDEDSNTPVIALLSGGGVSISAAQVPATLLPGASNEPLLALTLTNHYPEARTLRGIRLTNRTTGPGDQEQLDEEMGEIALYRDTNGDGTVQSGLDVFLLSTPALSGTVTFGNIPSVSLAAGATARLLVAIPTVALDARDGDAFDLSLDDSTAIEFDRPVFYRTPWPLAPAGVFPIDGMSWAQVAVDPVKSKNLLAGSADNLALEFLVPPNGYRADSLQRVAIVNFGTAASGTDITRVRTWVDDGDSLFDATKDRLLGDLVDTGDRWQRTGLLEPIPLTGLRLFIAVDLSDLASQGRTIRLGIPSGLDAGLGVRSGNDGPVDRTVENPFDLAISTVDRITLTAALIDSAAVRPGSRGILLHHFIATNSYADARTLTDLVYSNTTAGPGMIGQLDNEFEALTLRVDGDQDGVLNPAADPVLGTSFFAGGHAAFTGFAATIPPGKAVHFYLTGDVARRNARDGDILSTAIGSALDVGFAEATTTTAAWPLTSRTRATVDGMVAAQVTNVGAAGVTLGPGDGPAPALDVVIPSNGYESDVLHGLRVINRGSAGSADLEELRLYADGGDGAFTAGGGDDQDLGPMTPTGGSWTSAFLTVPVPTTGQRLFVSVRTSATPTDSTTVLLAIPFDGNGDGIHMGSGNNGPIDQPVENPRPIVISTSPLLATLETSAAASTVGQSISVRMIVRNAGTEPVLGVAPSALATSGSAGAVLDSGPAPSAADLTPAEVDTFTWTYHSSAAGEVEFRGSAQGTGAVSGVVRRAVETASNVHRVYTAAVELTLFPVSSMPFNVTRGQTGVVPFSLTLTNPGGPGSSDIRLRSLRIRLEDETGAGIVPADLLTRVQVNEGANIYLTRSSLETSGSEVDLTLASPLTITGQEPVTVSVRLDMADSSTTPAFRVVLADSTVFTAEDATSGAPVTVRREGGAFPVESGYARVVADATELRVQALAGGVARVSRGSRDVTLMTLRLENPGVTGITSDVQLSALGVTLADTSGVPIASASSFVNRVVARSSTQTYATRQVSGSDGADLSLLFSPPLHVPVNVPVDLILAADVADSARLGAYRVLLQPASRVEARDANSRDSVAVTYATQPIQGSPVIVEGAARSVSVHGAGLFPVSVLAGQRDVAAMRLVFLHAAPPGTARLRLDTLVVQLRDETRAPRVPDQFLGRIRLMRDGVEIANLTGLPTSGSSISIPMGGALLEPGDSSVAVILVDLSPSAPASFLEISVAGSGIRIADANTGLSAIVDPNPGVELPLVSGLTRIAAPARDLVAGWRSLIPAAVASDGREVPIATLTLQNPAPQGAGSIQIDHLRLRASDPALQSIHAGAVARVMAAYQGGTLWARSDTLGADSTEATLRGTTPLAIASGTSAVLELRLIPVDSPQAAAFRIGIDAGGVGVVQPGSALLTVQVTPEAGSAFPYWSETGSFIPASLAASWGNFPNPFAAGREGTSFVYFLPSDAAVTLRIWTPNGERVTTLVNGETRGAGLHQADVWDGRNGRGDVVRNGVYVAELIVHYANGSSDRARRKVAVVR